MRRPCTAAEIELLPLGFYAATLKFAEGSGDVATEAARNAKSAKDLVAALFAIATPERTASVWQSLPKELGEIYTTDEYQKLLRFQGTLKYPGYLVLGIALKKQSEAYSHSAIFAMDHSENFNQGEIEIRKSIADRLVKFLSDLNKQLQTEEAQALPYKFFDLVSCFLDQGNQALLECVVEEIINPGSVSMDVRMDDVYEVALDKALAQLMPLTETCILDATKQEELKPGIANCLQNLDRVLRKKVTENLGQ